MTADQVEKIRRRVKSITKTIKPGSKAAMELLVKSGIYDKTGKLRKAYR